MVTTTGIVCCNNPLSLKKRQWQTSQCQESTIILCREPALTFSAISLGAVLLFTIADDFLHIFSVYILFQQLYFYSFGKVRALQCRADAVKHFEIKSHSGTK